MKPIFDVVNEYLAGRAKTRLYGVYVIWTLLLHVPLIFSALFIDQNLIYEKTGLLKGEYLYDKFNMSSPNFIWEEIAKFVLAAVLTWLTIWILPRVLVARSYSREIQDEYNLRAKKVDYQFELEDKRKRLTDRQLQIVETQTKVQSEQKSIVNSEKALWGEEYKQFTNTTAYKYFSDIIESLYEHSGRIRHPNYNDKGITFYINTDTLAYSSTNDLIEIDPATERISITDKGKFFIKEYQLRHREPSKKK